jgi:hypothetical protein
MREAIFVPLRKRNQYVPEKGGRHRRNTAEPAVHFFFCRD